MEELENVLAIPREEVILASAKEGTGVPEILEAIVARIPPPKGSPTQPLQALVFDSHYDAVQGRRLLRAARPGNAPRARRHPPDGQRGRGGAPGARRVPAAARAGQAARGGRGRLRRHGPQERPRGAGRRHRDGRQEAGDRAAPRLPGGEEPRVRRPLPAQRARLPAAPRRAREAPPQRRELHVRAGDRRWRSGSGSGAGSSACCTWRSSRSASSASSTSTSSPARRRSSTASS